MALIFCDSFDHYATSLIGRKWDGVAGLGGSGVSNEAGSGRFGTAAARFNDDSGRYRYKLLPAKDTYIFGCAYMWTLAGDGSAWALFYEQGVGTHVRIHIDTGTKKLRANHGNGTLLGTGTTVLNASTYYWVEVKVKVHDTTGTVELRVNGNVEFALTGLDTRNGGSTGTIDTLWFQGQGGFSSGNWYMDDLYVCDTVDSGVSGVPNNDFLGDVRVQALLPNGNGASSQWTGSDGNSTDNYLLVDESDPNDDTDYVGEATVGDKDTYDYPSLTPTVGTVFGVQPLLCAKKTDTGARSIATVARLSGGTEADSANVALGTAYTYVRDMRQAKPGGGAWSISDVNGAQFGPKVTV